VVVLEELVRVVPQERAGVDLVWVQPTLEWLGADRLAGGRRGRRRRDPGQGQRDEHGRGARTGGEHSHLDLAVDRAAVFIAAGPADITLRLIRACSASHTSDIERATPSPIAAIADADLERAGVAGSEETTAVHATNCRGRRPWPSGR
jgi:hypothetical protein